MYPRLIGLCVCCAARTTARAPATSVLMRLLAKHHVTKLREAAPKGLPWVLYKGLNTKILTVGA